MIAVELLEILACPEDKTPVHLAGQSEIDALNGRIRAGEVENRAGDVVSKEVSGGLIREDGKFLYPVRDDIPIMLIDESISLSEQVS